MATTSTLDPYLKVTADARPSNYLVNHVSWPALNEIVNWSEIRLVRNTLGFPQTINDGTTIFTESSDSIIITVGVTASTALYLAKPITTFSYTGGGSVPFANTDGDYLYYTAVSGTGGSGTGAKFDVVRSKNDSGNVIGVTLNSPGEGYAVGDVITLTPTDTGKNSSGTISPYSNNIIITVNSNNGNPSSGLKSFTVTQPAKAITGAPLTGRSTSIKLYDSGIAGITTGTGTGKGATFSVVRDTAGVVTAVDLVSSGAGYKTGDIIRIPGSSIRGRSSSNVLGQTSAFHVFDNGTNTGLTTNPGFTSPATSTNVTSYGNDVNGNTNVTVVSTTNVVVGQTVSGNGIASGTVVKKIVGNVITLSLNNTSVISGALAFAANGIPGVPIFLSDKTLCTKYYYSIFVKYTVDSDTTNAIPFRWAKLAETSSFAVTDGSKDKYNATVRPTTLKNLLSHLPVFYTGSDSGQENADLKSFLSLFAFHLDCYLAENATVFNMSNSRLIDEIILPMYLKQLGSSYSNVNNVAQARTLMQNIIRLYQRSGAGNNAPNFIEAHTGYPTNIVAGTNILNSYNTSSFLEVLDSWWPDSSSYGYNQASPYTPYTSLEPPISSSGIASYANIAGVTLTSVSSNSNTFTCASTDGLMQGSVLTKSSGTGTFAIGTVVTNIVNTTTFKTNLAPTLAFSGATVNSSTNINGGMLKVNGVASNSATFYIGPKRVLLTADATSGTTSITVKPNTASVGDYVMSSTGGIAYETVVTAVNSSSVVTLSKPTIAAIASTGTELIFSPTAADRAGASASMVAIQPNKPYSFAVKTATPSTTKTTVVGMTWYDVNGSSISTASSGSSPATLATPGANIWGTAQISAVSPNNAAYVQPYVTISSLNADNYWISAAQVDNPIQIVGASINGGSTQATVLLDSNPNFSANNFISVTGMGYPYDGTFKIASVANNSIISSYQVTYNLGFTAHTAGHTGTGASAATTVTMLVSTSSVVVGQTVSGAGIATGATVLEISGLVLTLSIANTGPVSGVINFTFAGSSSSVLGYVASANNVFEDARALKTTIAANRVNLISNPSFETNSTGWTAIGTASVSTITSTTDAFLYGSRSLKLTLPAASTSVGATYSGATVGTTPVISVISGEQYTFSGYLNVTSGVTAPATDNFYAIVNWYNSSSTTPISTLTGTAVPLSTGSGWKSVSVTGSAPSGAVRADLTFQRTLASTAETTAYLDGVLVELSNKVNYYFDGSFDGQNYLTTRDSMWQGTAHFSPSHLYLNRVVSSGKIDSLLTDVIYYA